jgi:hypothetical protein
LFVCLKYIRYKLVLQDFLYCLIIISLGIL